HEIRTGKGEDDRDLGLVGDHGIHAHTLGFAVYQGHHEGPVLALAQHPADQVGALVAVEHRLDQLDGQAVIQLRPVRQALTQAADDQLAIPVEIRPGHIEGVLVENLPGEADQTATGDEAAGQWYPRGFAHRWAGTVDEHGAITDLVVPVHLEEHRVEPGFRQVIVEAVFDQRYIGLLDSWPAVRIKNVAAGGIGREPIPSFENALVV